MIKVLIFSFLIFGEFSELLVDSVLLSAFQYAASKKVFLLTPIFFSPKNHNSIQVHMVDELFLSINLVLTALKLFKLVILHFFLLNLLATYRNAGSNYFPSFNAESNYFPRIETRKVITFRIFDAGSKIQILS